MFLIVKFNSMLENMSTIWVFIIIIKVHINVKTQLSIQLYTQDILPKALKKTKYFVSALYNVFLAIAIF